MTLGPLMVDLVGLEMTQEEAEILQHPLVGGVILFSRNYESPEQLTALTSSIRALRDPHLLIAVDHEGGQVQRFREGFTHMPAAGVLGQAYQYQPEMAVKQAEIMGWLMAAELRAVGVDFSFAPVLDLNYGVSEVIGDRSFHREPEAVIALARSYIAGMKRAWMPAVGKHFPGHGAVEVDSHLGLPTDERNFDQIYEADMLPFRQLCNSALAGVMPAHIVYEKNDSLPAGFSPFWIKDVLRERLGFQGAVLSDDLSMAGAAVMGGSVDRAAAALNAGCDMVLLCNQPQSVVEVIDGLAHQDDPLRHMRLIRLHGRHGEPRESLMSSDEWKRAVQTVLNYAPDAELELTLT